MTRKEEIEKASNNYFIDFRLEGGKRTLQEHFERGAEWADKHPRKGLWDSEKVGSFIKDNADKYIEIVEGQLKFKRTLITDLHKAMED